MRPDDGSLRHKGTYPVIANRQYKNALAGASSNKLPYPFIFAKARISFAYVRGFVGSEQTASGSSGTWLSIERPDELYADSTT